MAGRDWCHGKVRHPSREMAVAHVNGLRAAADEHPSRLARLEAYQCPTCHAWHVGHSKFRKPLTRTA